MSGREWKPGDVALVKYGERPQMVAVRVDDGDEGHWHTDQDTTASGVLAEWVRPLVVIDPEDREQVERLYGLIDDAEKVDLDNFVVNADEWALNAMQAALREFANPNPPKPEQPTGIGAVVEDQNGGLWVQTLHEGSHGAWCKSGDGDTFRAWSEIPAVRVLSEGVRP